MSGPAGGVAGAAKIARLMEEEKIITFDMGGTSTDVSRIGSHFDYTFESEIDGIPVFSPMLAIETVAAGGGSLCCFDGSTLKVGPESAGADPGPACYGSGGPLTITDVNYLLGRLVDDNFGIPLTKESAKRALKEAMGKLRSEGDEERILMGFLQIANEKMADAIRKISLAKGYDASEYTLLAFGGAGGQNACTVADLLEMKKIIVPFDAGLLSAYGIGMADSERIVQRQLLLPLKAIDDDLETIFRELEDTALSELKKEGFSQRNCATKLKQVHMRLQGQESCLEVTYHPQKDMQKAFRQTYEKVYGHWLENEIIEVESVKVVAAGMTSIPPVKRQLKRSYVPAAVKATQTFTGTQWETIPVYHWEKLNEGAVIAGPALLLSSNSTVFIESFWNAELGFEKNVLLTRKSGFKNPQKSASEYAELELFTNRFRAVAADMGAILQRSSFSVNVKERLDFSCALLDEKGYLVANAPHIPVHLGSLGICVRSVIKKFKLEPGDTVVTNHPAFGGSHLPDISLIAGVFDDHGIIVGYVANRAHHAELGGKSPGSMPPDAKNLQEEGVVIPPLYLVKRGEAQWDTVKDLLQNAPFPSRTPEENLADLSGALASIRTGVEALQNLCRQFGSTKVRAYMYRLQEYASGCIMKRFHTFENKTTTATEFLDDGHRISVELIKAGQKVIFDFGGCSEVHPGNLNATEAIVNSAVIYVLRLMVQENIPLNEGIMQRVELRLPIGSFLNPRFYEDPAECPAVVGGNTEVSQRLVDTLLKALGLSACSQGTMNNLLFGNDRFGFYETICGGTGAGDGFHGTDAVHQHMTNTRITDPEILEKRYPVRLERMEVRHHSGGNGKWKGGNGVVRAIVFLEDVNLSILSQHRKVAPYGMRGGQPGQPGKQYLIKKGGSVIPLKGVDGVQVTAGDKIVVETPGGGGWGNP